MVDWLFAIACNDPQTFDQTYFTDDESPAIIEGNVYIADLMTLFKGGEEEGGYYFIDASH